MAADRPATFRLRPALKGAFLAGILLTGALGCTAQQPGNPPTVPTAPPAAVDAGAPGSLPASPGPLEPTAPLVTRSAALLLLTDASNPLRLTPQEKAELVELLDMQSDARDRWNFRMTRLYVATNGQGWLPVRDVSGSPPSNRHPEVLLLETIQELRPKLAEAAGGARQEAAPYPDVLQDGHAEDPTAAYESEPAAWEEDVPADRRQEVFTLALILPSVVEPLQGAQAAAALAELEAMEAPLRKVAEAWERILEIGTATEERKVTVASKALDLARKPQDWDAVRRQAGEWLGTQEVPGG